MGTLNAQSSTAKVAVVTGGGSGIGRAVATAAAQRGLSVAVLDCSEENAHGVCEEIRKAGGNPLPLVVDVSRKSEVQERLSRVLREWGQVDTLINCAGISNRKPAVELSEEDWDRMIEVNLKGTFLCCQAVLPHMFSRRQGRIVNTASNYGAQGSFQMVHYAASKGGVIALTKSLALEGAPYQVLVNVVAPGPVETPLVPRTPEQVHAWEERIPLRRIATPQDLVGAYLFLAAGQSEYFTGQVFHVNGGAYMGW